MTRDKSKEEKDYLKIRRNIRDSVFQSIITKPKYLREIYLSLYPEDKDIKEEDLKIIKTAPVFIGGAIHDCCFTVRDEKVIFIEVQSTLCRLLPERMLRYYTESITSINTGFEREQYSINGTRMLEPEFWVVHVGDNPSVVPEFYKKEPVEGKLYIPLRVKTEYNTDGLLYEYCLFSSIYRGNQKDEKMSKKEVVSHTLKRCIEEGIMKEFLMEHQGEVAEIMSETNEYYFQKYVEGRIEEASALGEARGEARGREIGEARGKEIGEAQGEARGREIERKNAMERLSKSGLDKELQQYLCEMLFAK